MNYKQVFSWCFFDFANSSYSAVISAVIFPVFYTTMIVGNLSGGGDLWWGCAVSLSMLFVACTSPFLGGIADYGGLRKRLLILYTVVSIAAVTCFSVLTPGAVIEGFFLIIFANIGMEGGVVFYNSFLPRIAPAEYQGRVSSWGFGLGYAGSIVSLMIAVPLITRGWYALTWVTTAAFFAIFSLPAFFFLPKDAVAEISPFQAGVRGFQQAWKTLHVIVNRKNVKKFMFAYFFYEDGVNTVIVFSSVFAATTLHFGAAELIALYLTVQATALAGSLLLAEPMDTWGPKRVVILSLVLWILVAVTAYFVQTKTQFWAVACTAGLGLGTIQAGTRALYTQFIPQGEEAEYFGVYSLVGKSSAVLGPLIFGSVSSAFSSQRPAILSIVIFFIAGLILLARVQGGGPTVHMK